MHTWELVSSRAADRKPHFFLETQNRIKRHPETLEATGECLAVFILVVIVRLFSLERKPGNVFLLFSVCVGFPEN